MTEFFNRDRFSASDMDIYHCGIEDCVPGHSYGPAVRDHFLIHYIRSGRGVFQVGNHSYQLKKGQGFLICPDIITYYQADWDDPWHYSWIGFQGLRAEEYLKSAGLTVANPVLSFDGDNFLADCLAQMVETSQIALARETRLKGLLYLFLAKLIEIANSDYFFSFDLTKKELYIKKAIEFIRMNYSRKITISQVANYIGLDRSYISSLFKDYLKVSPQEFLISFRIDKACELMANDLLSIGDISRSVGYDDQLQFSKIFKKAKGVAPREYRKSFK
jgi:AraC-like DNA-binding protein